MCVCEGERKRERGTVEQSSPVHSNGLRRRSDVRLPHVEIRVTAQAWEKSLLQASMSPRRIRLR